MKNSVLLYVIHLLLIFINLKSQVNHEWVKFYDGNGNYSSFPHKIKIDNSNNIYITGRSFDSTQMPRPHIVKYRSDGFQLWSSIIPYIGEPSDLQIDNSGDIIITGYCSYYGNSIDAFVAKYSDSGEMLWLGIYDTNQADEFGRSVAVSNDGCIYIGGSISDNAKPDYLLIKFSSYGSIDWVRRYNGPGNHEDFIEKVKIDNSGFIYVTGYSSYDYYTIKYDETGRELWNHRYNGLANSNDIVYDMEIDDSDNLYITGASYSGPNNFLDYATIKYNSAGAIQWISRYDGPGHGKDYPYDMVVDNKTGDVFVTGKSTGPSPSFDYDFCTIKYNSSGMQQWVNRYSEVYWFDDVADAIQLDLYGNVYVTGVVHTNYWSGDYCTIKYSSNGEQKWIAKFDNRNSYDSATGLVIDKNGNIIVTGSTANGSAFSVFGTVKYSQPIGIQPVLSEIPRKYNLFQNYPNPFNPITNIRFSIPKESFVKLAIFDILGREVNTLVNDNLEPATYEVNWNADVIPSGVYFYRIIAGNYSETKKMLLVK